MKKLCAITTVQGTMETFVIPSMRLFAERGFDVTLICSMDAGFIEKYSKDFNLINVPMQRGISIKELFTKPISFYKIFRKHKFDYVQYATTNATFYASIAAFFAHVPVRVNCVWGLLYSASTGIKRGFYWLLEKIPCMFSNYFTVASHKNRELAIADHLCRPENATVIGDGGTIGVDLSEFDYNKREIYNNEILNKYPVLKGKTVFGFVGRIDVDKGINELLEAFINLNDPGTALMLIGNFDSLRSGLNAELLTKAEKQENIIFTGFTREVPLYLSAVDIIVHPTYREGFSMVLQQAMAMGCGIITTDIPGPSEVIVEDECGLLVPSKDADALRIAMEKLAGDDELLKSFVDNGLKRVSEKFSRERMLELTYADRCDMMKKAGVL